MHDLSKLYSQNNLVICKPLKNTGLKTKQTAAGLGFVSQTSLVEELEVLSPTATDAKVQVKPGDSIFVRTSTFKDNGTHHSLAPDPVKAGDKAAPVQEFIVIPYEAVIFVLSR